MSETMTADEVIDDARENLDCEDDVTCCEENQEEASSEVEEVAGQETESETEETPPEKRPKTVKELKQDHYEQICDLNLRVYGASCEHEEADRVKKGKKKALDNLTAALTSLIMNDPLQRVLGFNGDAIPDAPAALTHRTAFAGLWDSIYKQQDHGWGVNEWVVALTFKRMELER